MPFPSTVAKTTVWFLLLSHAAAQDDKNCSVNPLATLPLSSRYSEDQMNATGHLDVKGFGNQTDPAADKQWTWSTGIQESRNNTKNETLYGQPIWLDTHGTNLASESLGYNLCYYMQTGHSQSQQKRGYGDNGDCTTFYPQQCVDDWKKLLVEEALRFKETPDEPTPCIAARSKVPKSCDKYKYSFSFSGRIPPESRKCPFGEGSPYLDLVSQTGELAAPFGKPHDPKDFAKYDEIVTTTIPFMVLAWSNNTNDSNWADARVMCLSTPNITEGSRDPGGVPSSSSVYRVDMFALISVFVAFMLL